MKKANVTNRVGLTSVRGPDAHGKLSRGRPRNSVHLSPDDRLVRFQQMELHVGKHSKEELFKEILMSCRQSPLATWQDR